MYIFQKHNIEMILQVKYCRFLFLKILLLTVKYFKTVFSKNHKKNITDKKSAKVALIEIFEGFVKNI